MASSRPLHVVKEMRSVVASNMITVITPPQVEEGAIVVTLEAMKMQNPLFAPMTGKVSTIKHQLDYFLWQQFLMLFSGEEGAREGG